MRQLESALALAGEGLYIAKSGISWLKFMRAAQIPLPRQDSAISIRVMQCG